MSHSIHLNNAKILTTLFIEYWPSSCCLLLIRVFFSQAHKGMLSSAKYIKKELEDYGILDKAFAMYPEYKLVLAGTYGSRTANQKK